MERFTKFCCKCCSTKDEETKFQTLRVMKHNDEYTITAARFSPNDIPRKVVIWFNNCRTMMYLNIEGAMDVKIDVRTQTQGNFKFRMNEMIVQFMWDIDRTPLRFLFFTKLGASDCGGNCGNTSNDGGGEQVGQKREGDESGMLKWPDALSEDYKDGYVLRIFGV